LYFFHPKIDNGSRKMFASPILQQKRYDANFKSLKPVFDQLEKFKKASKNNLSQENFQEFCKKAAFAQNPKEVEQILNFYTEKEKFEQIQKQQNNNLNEQQNKKQ
jgi:hypothetical protein